MTWKLYCWCGRTATMLGAMDLEVARPRWEPLCRKHYREGETDGYWLSVEDLRAHDPAWWLCHIEGKSWGARSDFRHLIGGIVEYAPDPRVRRVENGAV